MQKGERDIGSGNAMYVPKEERAILQPFDPHETPNVKPVDWETIPEELNTEIKTLQEQVYDQKQALKAAEDEYARAKTPHALKVAGVKIKLRHAPLRDKELALDDAKRKLENRYKSAADDQAKYVHAVKKHERLLIIHAKWVSYLKEYLDPFDTEAIRDKPNFYLMIDEMYHRCNSQNKGNMMIERNGRWKSTGEKYFGFSINPQILEATDTYPMQLSCEICGRS